MEMVMCMYVILVMDVLNYFKCFDFFAAILVTQLC